LPDLPDFANACACSFRERRISKFCPAATFFGVLDFSLALCDLAGSLSIAANRTRFLGKKGNISRGPQHRHKILLSVMGRKISLFLFLWALDWSLGAEQKVVVEMEQKFFYFLFFPSYIFKFSTQNWWIEVRKDRGHANR
jgi:hypothetical protein